MTRLTEMKLRVDDQGRLDYPIRILDGENVVALVESRGHSDTPNAMVIGRRLVGAFNAYQGVHTIPMQTIKTYLEDRVANAPERQQEAFQEVLTVLCGQQR